MRHRGCILKFNTSKGGFGQIIDESKLVVNFERCECNYDYIRAGDEVIYDLIKISDGSFEALDIEFNKNSILSELDSAFQKQKEIHCKVILKTPKGFIIDYKGITMYLPEKEIQGKTLAEGDNIILFIKYFSYGAKIIASLSKTNYVFHYQRYIGKRDGFEFEIFDINDSGLIVFENDTYGFIPNSHLGPLNLEDINIGESIIASVIGCSLKKGLILSIRNYLKYDILVELNEAFKEQKILSGKIKSIYSRYIIVNYKGIDLVLNKLYILNSEINKNELLEFKIVHFSWSKTISVSNTEISEKGILSSLRNDNMFMGTVKEIWDNGALISINEFYTGFMPNEEMSDNWKLDLSCIKEGSKIKASIIRFDCKGLILSRLNYIKKIKRRIALNGLHLGDSMELKIVDKMANFGVLVSNNNVKGLICLESILPIGVIKEINLLEFTKYCKPIFKRRAHIKCLISGINKKENKIEFEPDYSITENFEKVNNIINFFKDNRAMKQIVSHFYDKKIKNQKKDAIKLLRTKNNIY